MADYLGGVPGAEVVILDNGSTWGPLLDWYASCPYEVRRLGRNIGHRAPWVVGAVFERPSPFYVVTDPDLDISAVPKDLLQVLHEGLRRYPERMKCGLSLELRDLPEGLRTEKIRAFQEKFWTRRLDARYFDAGVDTTLAMYHRSRRDIGFAAVRGHGLRTDRPYTARHLPWYVKQGEEDAEEKNYLATASASSTWARGGP